MTPDIFEVRFGRDQLYAAAMHARAEPDPARYPGLTDVELAVCDHTAAGTTLDLEHAATDADRTIRADTIRRLLLGRLLPADQIDPHGIQLTHAIIDGSLDLDHLTTPTPLAITHSTLSHSVTARHAHLRTIDLTGTTITGKSQAALDLDGATITGGLVLDHTTITSASRNGAVLVRDAHITEGLRAVEATLTGITGPALAADGMTVGGGVSLTRATISVTGRSPDGALRLTDAHIGGQLTADRTTITGAGGPALAADRMIVDSGVSLAGATISITGDSPDGALRLLGARIVGQLTFREATITGAGGSALSADGMTVDGDVILTRATISVTGNSPGVAVRLLGAHIGGQLTVRDATITGNGNPALAADRMTLDGSVFLTGASLTVSGDSPFGTLRLLGVHIGGQLAVENATVTGSYGPALYADGMTVNGDVVLTGARMTAVRSRDAIVVSVSPARFGGLDLNLAPFLDGGLRLVGLRFDGPIPGTAAEWRRILKSQSDYRADPYQFLAGRYLADGHVADQRTLLVAQQDDRRSKVLRPAMTAASGRAKLRLRARRIGLVISWAVIGYGYRPWRATVALLFIVGAATAVVMTAAQTHTDKALRTDPHYAVVYQAYRPPDHAGDTTHPCSTGEQFGLALRIAVPLIGNVTQGTCQITTTTPTGSIYAAAGYLLQLLSWATATLLVAGYTNIIRRT